MNPILRGMNPEELNDTFNTLFEAARRPVKQDPPPKPVEPKKTSSEDLKARFDSTSDSYDPKGAIMELVEENYAPLLTDISARANAGLKSNLRATLPDFSEHEADIDAALANVPAGAINQAVLVDTYLRVVGVKSLKQKLADREKPPTTREPKPRPETEEPQLSEEEVVAAKRMFRNTADPIAAWRTAEKMRKEGGVTVKVPGEK